MKTIAPIDWPDWWSRNEGKRHFLEGVPFIGPQARILSNAKALLLKRNKDEVDKCWLNYSEQVPVVPHKEKLFFIAHRYLKWPNLLFLPNDRAAIVFGLIPGIWIDPEDIIEDIACEFAIDKKKLSKLFESASRNTLIEFFIYLSAVM